MARNEYDKTIQETEAAYMKILESSQTLLHVLKREATLAVSMEDEPPTLVFLGLPDDILRRIAACSGASAVVVACASRGTADKRLALRKGVDDFERARFCGRPGLTIREAEQMLPEYAEDLTTRRSAGKLLATSVLYDNCSTLLVERFLVYGASPNERVRANMSRSNGHWLGTPLHWVARLSHRDSLAKARLLVAAGADINAMAKNVGAGPSYRPRHSPLTWALSKPACVETGGIDSWVGEIISFDQREESVCAAVAIYLLERGADARQAARELAEVEGALDGGDPAAFLIIALRDSAEFLSRGGQYAAQLEVLVKLIEASARVEVKWTDDMWYLADVEAANGGTFDLRYGDGEPDRPQPEPATP